MATSLDLDAARLLSRWVRALEELQDEAVRVHGGDSDPDASIAVLHVLEQRAHEAFASYRDQLLGR